MFRILCLVFMVLSLTACEWSDPKDVGLYDGDLHGCPDSPNCVSTLGEKARYVAPIKVKKSADTGEVMDDVEAILSDMPGAKLRQSKPNYRWFVFKSKLGFVDDLEVYYHPEKHELSFRSASRVGFHDLGQNRARYRSFACKLSEKKIFIIEDNPCLKRSFALW